VSGDSLLFPCSACYFRKIFGFSFDFLGDLGFTPRPLQGFTGAVAFGVVPPYRAGAALLRARHQFGARTDPVAIYIT
jgi:hypothetical protein